MKWPWPKRRRLLPTLPDLAGLHRRSPEGASAYVRGQAERHLSQAMSIRVNKLPAARDEHREDLFYAYIRHKALFILYDGLGSDPYMDAEALSALVLDRIADELAGDFENEFSLDRLTAAFASDDVLVHSVPALVDGRLAQTLDQKAWERAEHQARLRDLKQRDKAVYTLLESERDRIAQLFDDMQSALDDGVPLPQLAPHIWEVESAQDRIRALKRRLLLPVPPHWQDEAGIDRLMH
ncbi:hypothetical protein GCM10007989_22900 [Devosia pacifica]|uniref:Uncharacterized protein n=1 Tax=Devosia pacifica TaxID=1335967 RepID=A0A918VUE7_9HYPH|nr:hypothetical protein [Devosia pacifica]GHA26524.1 hypothetical protein GCM10007989_22900 [Devosia pacifica]